MNLQLDRFFSDADTSVGLLRVNGERQCFIIEDEFREKKVPGETRIPAGKYKLIARAYGGFYNRYSQKWDWHQEMIEVADIIGFTDVLIHPGNTDGNTEGCLLPNASASMTLSDIRGATSVAAYKNLYLQIIDSVRAGEATITITDSDRWLL